ncbi:MAG: c-type cytochrome [Deltaproteobacteria bacterium]|nr:c-type cytochrome [Deltaproteobacteria bacterium]
MKVVLVLSLALAACKADASGGSTEGPTIFETMCATCHGPGGKPDAAMIARMNVRDLTGPEFRARVTVELVEKQVRFGSDNKLMPALGTSLKPEQIKAVSEWVASDDFVKRR